MTDATAWPVLDGLRPRRRVALSPLRESPADPACYPSDEPRGDDGEQHDEDDVQALGHEPMREVFKCRRNTRARLPDSGRIKTNRRAFRVWCGPHSPADPVAVLS